MSNSTSTNTASTPGLRDTPILGNLFRGFNRNDQSTELVVVVNPVVVREPIQDEAMWAFPTRGDMLKPLLTTAAPPVTK